MRREVRSVLVLLLLVTVDAMAGGIVVTPQQLAELVRPGQRFRLVMKSGHSGSGKVLSVGDTVIALKVKKSQDRTVLATGPQTLPYDRIASISVVTQKGNKRTMLPLILCSTLGTLALVAASGTEELKSTYVPRALGFTAGLAIGGYYLGKTLDQQIVTYVIKQE